MKKEKILYIHPSISTFIKSDINFLSRNYNVIENSYNWKKKMLVPFFLIKQFFFLLLNVFNSKSIIISFGGYWSLFPSIIGKLFKTPVFIILNGTDCVSFPNYNYGSLRKPILKYFIKYSYYFAYKLLPVSESLVYNNYTFDSNCKFKYQGFKFHFPKLKTNNEVVYNGFDAKKWQYNPELKKTNSFITVASINNYTTFYIKGIDKFIALARIFKNCDFTIVGISQEMIKSLIDLPKNVHCYHFLNQEELNKKYQEQSFYLQLSINEGFGCSLSEAMLTGCIPIGSNVGIISKIIGRTGFVVEKNELELMKEALQKALNLSLSERIILGKKSIGRISKMYPMEKREKQLLKIIDVDI